MSEFDQDDLALIKELDAAESASLQAGGQQANPNQGDAGNATDAGQTGASESTGAATTQTATDTAKTTTDGETSSEEVSAGEQVDDRPKGDLRAALRASRHAERQRGKENDALRERMKELEAQVQTSKAASKPAMTEDQLAAIEEDFPEQAAAIRELQNQVKQLETQRPAQAATQQEAKEFTPVILPAHLQDAVDETPDLLAWQLDQDQTNFDLARQADAMLDRSPKWAGKPYPERFAEVVRLVKEQTGQAKQAAIPAPAAQQSSKKADPADALAKAKAVIDKTAPQQAIGISDIRGGSSGGQAAGPDYSRMSDDEIIASL